MDSNHDFRVQERNVSNPRDALDRLAVTVNQLFNRIEVVMRQLRQFVTDGSHELRTPLAILQGETELLLSRREPLKTTKER